MTKENYYSSRMAGISDSELQDYIDNNTLYDEEAILAAIWELEKRNLGTKATRANILETLYDRGYIREKSIEATSLGISLIDTLNQYSPIIIDQKLTRSFEESMEKIRTSTKDWVDKEKKVIDKAKKTITSISKDFEKHEKSIGKELIKATDKLRETLRAENTLNKCPTCKEGNLLINYSKKTRRQFVACDAYPNCKNTFSLPPNSILKKSDKNCESCGFPLIISFRKGKKPWIFCFNPECETNKERIEAYQKKKEEESKDKK